MNSVLTAFELQKQFPHIVKKHIEKYFIEWLETACVSETEKNEIADSPALQLHLMEQLEALAIQVQMADDEVIEASPELRKEKTKEVVDEFVAKQKRKQGTVLK